MIGSCRLVEARVPSVGDQVAIDVDGKQETATVLAVDGPVDQVITVTVAASAGVYRPVLIVPKNWRP